MLRLKAFMFIKIKKIAVSTSDYLKEIQNAKVLLDACPSDSKLYILPEKFAFKQKMNKDKMKHIQSLIFY